VKDNDVPFRFSVTPENRDAALAHLAARGIVPDTIEIEGDGLVVLIFSPRPDAAMFELVQAMPHHLSAKIGIIGGPPF